MSEEAATEFDPDEESWEAFRERAKRQGGPWTRCLLCYATIPGTNQFAHALYGDCPGVIRKEIGGGETSKPAEVVEWWLCPDCGDRTRTHITDDGRDRWCPGCGWEVTIPREDDR